MPNRCRGRDLQVGDKALTDFNGVITEVEIIDRLENVRGCQSQIMFRVRPALRNGSGQSLYDADWFWPVDRRADTGASQDYGGTGK